MTRQQEIIDRPVNPSVINIGTLENPLNAFSQWVIYYKNELKETPEGRILLEEMSQGSLLYVLPPKGPESVAISLGRKTNNKTVPLKGTSPDDLIFNVYNTNQTEFAQGVQPPLTPLTLVNNANYIIGSHPGESFTEADRSPENAGIGARKTTLAVLGPAYEVSPKNVKGLIIMVPSFLVHKD